LLLTLAKPTNQSITVIHQRAHGSQDMRGESMSDAYVIEVQDQAAGIVARERIGFRFYAAQPAFNALEGRIFDNPRKAEQAAQQIMRQRRAPAYFKQASRDLAA